MFNGVWLNPKLATTSGCVAKVGAVWCNLLPSKFAVSKQSVLLRRNGRKFADALKILSYFAFLQSDFKFYFCALNLPLYFLHLYLEVKKKVLQFTL